VNKIDSFAKIGEKLSSLEAYLRIVVVVDAAKNDLDNPYMLLWRVANNIDAGRDISMCGKIVSIDGTDKTRVDGFEREWPGDVNCTSNIIEKLKSLHLWDLDPILEKKYQL
jgi:4-hydroxy-3-polyprenylbenzoate decarboxylase